MTMFSCIPYMCRLSRQNGFLRTKLEEDADLSDLDLDRITYNNTKAFVPPVHYGKVIKVYDGDTFTIGTALYNQYFRFSVRMAGIDCAELKGSGENEKQIAIQSRDRLSEKIMNKTIKLENVKMDKYGRLLADIYVLPITNPLKKYSVNQWMLDQGYAVPYDGGKKHRPPEWDS